MSSLFLTLAFLDVGGGEMLLIFFVVLMLFGGQKLPEFARGLGKSIREFKKATAGVEDQIKRAIEEEPAPVRSAAKAPVHTPTAVIEPIDDSAPKPADTALPPPPEKPAV